MTTDLRPYPEMTASSLRWLEPIPSHWNFKRAKCLYREVDERSNTGDEELCSVSHKTGVTPRKANVTMFKAETTIGYKICRPDDLVINTLWAWMAALGVAKQVGVVSPAYGVYRPRSGSPLLPAYAEYLLRTPQYKHAYIARSTGVNASRLRLYPDQFLRIPILLPPPDEQKAIADYLDADVVKVRRFIRNRRRLIEVLNEQKQAIINRAVTRCLDPNIPLKPSGIDGLGDIPEHWVVKPLKRWASMNGRVLPETTDPDYAFDYLDIGCVETGRLVEKPSRIRFGDAPSRARRILRCGDTIISTVRTYLRAVYFVAEDVSDLIASTGFAVLAPRAGVVPEYLGITLQSDPFINRVTANSIGIAYPAIAETKLGTFHVAMPPSTDEQRAIVAQVRSETAALTAWIEQIQREINLIREYRTRLIADVVTGKVDVRQGARTAVAAKQTKRTANVHFRRSVFAAEIVHRLHDEPTFGHVKFEKLIFLCEKRCGVDTGSTYYRKAAGPYDNKALRSIDSQIKKQKWYEARQGEKGYRYLPLENAGGHKDYFDRYFGELATPFDEIIDTFRTARTVQCEIVATLYAAWEDLLAQGNATDDQIIEQVLHHWHPSKQEISEDRWRRALGWMKAKGLTPDVDTNQSGTLLEAES